MLRSVFGMACFVLVVVFAAIYSAGALAAESGKPNVLVILIDDFGYGDARCFNDDSKIETPHINALASAGMRFTDAHAPGPLCHLSRYGLITGRYPFRTNVNVWRTKPVIQPDRTTIASLLKDQGYETAMVGKWHLGFNEQGYDKPLRGGPVDVGFDSFFGIRASTDIPPYFYVRDTMAVSPPTAEIAANNSPGWTKIQGAFWREGKIAPDLKLADVLPRFTDEAVSVIETHADAKSGKPLMLYLAYPAPHTPWLPSKEFAGKSKAGMYGDFAEMVDSQIGRVLKTLKDSGMSDDTLVIFSSDNGPVWYDQDVQKFGHASVGPLRGMKADAWEGGHRMPFIVRWPGKVKAGSTSNQMICFTDLLATFAGITGAKLAPEAGPDSVDFSKVLLGTQPEDQPVRKSLAIRSGRAVMTVRMGDWKLIQGLGSGGFSSPSKIKPTGDEPPGQLYNLADDLGETDNLYLTHPDKVAELTAELNRIRGE